MASVKVIQLVKWNWPPFWVGVSFSPLVYALRLDKGICFQILATPINPGFWKVFKFVRCNKNNTFWSYEIARKLNHFSSLFKIISRKCKTLWTPGIYRLHQKIVYSFYCFKTRTVIFQRFTIRFICIAK